MATERMPATRRMSAALAAASMVAAVGACGDDDATDSSTDDESGGTTTTEVAAGTTAEFTNLGDDESITTTEYVGAIEGTDIYAAFAISTKNEDDSLDGAFAYFCDGESVAKWFRVVDGSDGLVFEAKDGTTFEATVDDGTLTASVPLGEETHDVTAVEVDADGEAGLYLADHVIDADLATDERGGWVVLPDGTQRGAISGGTTVLGGPSLTPTSPTVTVAGREILLRAITHIIGLDKKT